MKKATLSTVVALLSDLDFDGKEELMNELYTDLNRGAEEKARKNAEYENAWPVVHEALEQTSNITMADLFNECAKSLPNDFTKGRLQYAMTRVWTDRVVKTDGKPNTYSLR